MRAYNKPVIIWHPDGCWYQDYDDQGRMRSSYLGHIGTPEEVGEWCGNNAVDFTTKFDWIFGTAIRVASHKVA